MLLSKKQESVLTGSFGEYVHPIPSQSELLCYSPKYIHSHSLIQLIKLKTYSKALQIDNRPIEYTTVGNSLKRFL